MKDPKKSRESAKILVSSLKELKERFLPEDEKKSLYEVDDPKRLGIEIADRVYEKNRHVLFGLK